MILLTPDYWEAKNTTEKGKGLFAKKAISPGLVIGDYLGTVLRNSELNITDDPSNFYLMYYHDRASIYPDLNKIGIHLLNHSCTPNVGLYVYQGHILFFTLKKIFTGEELTVSYMLSPKDEMCNPCQHICKCGAKFCSKTMHLSEEEYSAWRSFQEVLSKKTKPKRITYNKFLPKLDSYPKTIVDHPIYRLFGNTLQVPYASRANKLPSTKELRNLIRKNGQILEFLLLNKRVLGISSTKVVSESVI